VSIHCVRAWDCLAGVLASEPPLPSGMVLHACAAPVELLPWLLDRGALCSFAGSALRRNHHRAHAAVRAVPRDRLLLETDAPDLPPPRAFQPFGGRGAKVRNEPGNLPAIAHGIAALRGEPVEVLVAAAWENARRLLGPVYPALREEPAT
jgi:TatD DNase family protein